MKTSSTDYFSGSERAKLNQFHPDFAPSRLMGTWTLGEPIPRIYSPHELEIIAGGSDERCTPFFEEYLFREDRRNPILGYNLICAAAQSGNEKRVEKFLDKDMDPNAYDGFESPLHIAIRKHNVAMVKILLSGKNGQKKADINARNKYKETPLHLAAEGGQIEIVDFLLAQGASVKAKDEDENTPLHLAAEGGQIEIAQCLLAKGASVKAKNDYGKTPLDLANELKDSEINQQLRDSLMEAKGSGGQAMNLLRQWSQGFRNFWRRFFRRE